MILLAKIRTVISHQRDCTVNTVTDTEQYSTSLTVVYPYRLVTVTATVWDTVAVCHVMMLSVILPLDIWRALNRFQRESEHCCLANSSKNIHVLPLVAINKWLTINDYHKIRIISHNYSVSGKKLTPCIDFHNSCKQCRILTKFCNNNATSDCKQIRNFIKIYQRLQQL